MTEPTLHIAFTDSGAGSLRSALASSKSQDEVITLTDAPNFGPVEYSDPAVRERWMEEVLGLGGYDWVIECSVTFWSRVLTDTRPKVLWTSRRSAMEYCGFLECLWRLKDTPCSVVDLTNVKVRYPRRDGTLSPPKLAVSLATVPAEIFQEQGLLNLHEEITPDVRAHYHNLWNRLRKENAPFRVVGATGIASAPINYFDDFLVSCVSSDWQKSARVVGEALGRETDTEYWQVGDLVLFSRLQVLAKEGKIESRGDMANMQASELRLRG